MRINIRVGPGKPGNGRGHGSNDKDDNRFNEKDDALHISSHRVVRGRMIRGHIHRNNTGARGKQRLYLAPDTLLRYFITDDESVNTLIIFKNTEYNLVTSDANLYQALGSIKEYDNFKLNKLVKLLEVVDVFSTHQAGREKLILKEERIEELRKLAIKKAE